MFRYNLMHCMRFVGKICTTKSRAINQVVANDTTHLYPKASFGVVDRFFQCYFVRLILRLIKAHVNHMVPTSEDIMKICFLLCEMEQMISLSEKSKI